MNVLVPIFFTYYVFGFGFLGAALLCAWINGTRCAYLRLALSIPVMALVWPIPVWMAFRGKHDD